jgi:hypothetical protein
MNSIALYYKQKFLEELIAYFPWYGTDHIENNASNNSYTFECVFVTAVTFLPSRCLAAIRGFLPSRCLAKIWGFLPSRWLATIKGYTYRHTDWWEGFMKYAVETGSGAKFHEYWFRLSKVNRGDTQTHRQQRDLINILYFFKIRKLG